MNNSVKLDEAGRRFAAENLNETDNIKDAYLEEIRSWLSESSGLNARLEDQYILPFLRGCKFDLKKTKQKLTNYYTMKRDRPEWFNNRDPLIASIQELIKLGIFVPLSKTHENKLVMIIRTAAHDPKRHKWNDVFKTGKMILDVACQDNELAQIYGVIAIFDMTGMGFAHYRTLTPTIIKNAVYSWQNYHVRPKQLEFVNSPPYINVALNIFKSFMTEKMKGRVKAHFGGIEKTHSIVPKEILPIEYGGSCDSLEILGEFWFNKLLERREWFKEDEIYKAN